MAALWLLLRSFLVQSSLVDGCSLTSLSELFSIVTGGYSRWTVYSLVAAVDKSRNSKSVKGL